MNSFKKIAVVGTSLAGLRAIEALRREGYAGEIIAIGEEPVMPYDRPPLSKQYLKGDWDPDKITLRHALEDDAGVEWMLGKRAVSLDIAAQRLQLDDGEAVAFDGL
ncbi:MAG TPA: NAD(P)/FAD-dependent oxidoreductase, partial [Myxococcales bacterium]|nr:NAD(P)/FAD-dependent oxidoreductase [Myxococcales bacterium]